MISNLLQKYSVLLFLLAHSFSATGQNEFITIWKTDNSGITNDNQIRLPISPAEASGLMYNVDWGDNTSDVNVTSSQLTHTYSQPGTYTVKITGDPKVFRFRDYGDPEKLVSIEQWGNIPWERLDRAFQGCINLEINAPDRPDLSGVTSLSFMFADCPSFTSNINHWDVSSVKDFSRMFFLAEAYDQPLNQWNTSSATSFYGMFWGATSFNQPLDQWITSNVTEMNYMFFGAEAFNQPINTWDVSNVEKLFNMFEGAISFNQPLNNWVTSSAINTSFMFERATSFDQPLNSWDMSAATSMQSMFEGASSFNQPLDKWDVSSVTDMQEMFKGAAFNQPIESWNVQNVKNLQGMFAQNEFFNQPLNSWDVSNVSDFQKVFYDTKSFNQPLDQWNTSSGQLFTGMFEHNSFDQDLSSWNTSGATDMSRMFYNSPFNQPIGTWDVDSVKSFAYMFNRAYNFDQALASWKLDSAINVVGMLSESGLSTKNYDSTLIAWQQYTGTPDSLTLGANNLKYCVSEEAREALTSSKGWSFSADSRDCIRVEPQAFSFNENLEEGTSIGFVNATQLLDQPITYTFQNSTQQTFKMDASTGEITVGDNKLLDFENRNIISYSLTATDGVTTETFFVTFNILNLNDPHEAFDYTYTSFEYPDLTKDFGKVQISDQDDNASYKYEILVDSVDAVFMVNDTGAIMVKNPVLLPRTNGNPWKIPVRVYDSLYSDTATVTLSLLSAKEKLPSSLNRFDAVSASLGDTISFFGLGKNDTASFNDFYQFDPELRVFNRKADFPGVARHGSAVFTIQEKIYIGSGKNDDGQYQADFYVFDISSNQWSTISNIPLERSGAVAFAMNGKGYVGTGVNETGDLKDFWEYNPETDVWVEVSGFTGDARRDALAFIIDSTAYVAGGFNFDGDSTFQLTDMQALDLYSNKWTEIVAADPQLGISNGISLAIKGQGILGYGNQDYLLVFDPLTSKVLNIGDTLHLDEVDVGPVRSGSITFQEGGKTYLAYGRGGFSPSKFFNNIKSFSVSNQTPESILLSDSLLTENYVDSVFVGSLSTVDRFDEGKHQYSFAFNNNEKSADNSLFAIFGSNLYFMSTANYEDKDRYRVAIESTDEQGLSTESYFTIYVQDENDAPVVNNSTYSVRFSENQSGGVSLFSIDANDEDGDQLFYGVYPTEDYLKYQLTGNEVITLDTVAYDFEEFTRTRLNLFVTDQKDTADFMLTLDLENVNEGPKGPDSLIFSIDESVVAETFIDFLNYQDPEGDQITYRATGGTGFDSFTIKNNNQVYTTAEDYDYEKDSIYFLEFEATDGLITENYVIQINIEDVNEAPSIESESIVITTDYAIGDTVAVFIATDPENNMLEFALTDAPSVFDLTQEGVLLLRELLDAAAEYVFEVVVSDGEYSASATVQVSVENNRKSVLSIQKPSINLYPNPAVDYVYIDFDGNSNARELSIFDTRGRLIRQQEILNNQIKINVSSLPKGIYLLKIDSTEDLLKVIKN